MNLVVWKIISKNRVCETVLDGLELESFLSVIKDDPDLGVITIIPL